MEIGLSLGSNLGDRSAALIAAKNHIDNISSVTVVESSPVYETAPVDVSAEHEHLPFLNAVVIVETESTPQDLLEEFHRIERDMGRSSTAEPNAPRTIDIDIIYADDLEMDTPELTIPHARWHQRRFVAQPLSDVRPQLILPGQDRTVSEILADLPTSPGAERAGPLA